MKSDIKIDEARKNKDINTELITKAIITVLGVSLILVTLSWLFKKPENSISEMVIRNKENISLPDKWQKINDNKYQKNIDGYKPTIALAETEIGEVEDIQKYIDRLVNGARSTIPTLRINTNQKIESEKMQGRKLGGYYYQGKQMINLVQLIDVRGKRVMTVSGSYQGKEESTQKEIEMLLEKIIGEKWER
jgi:hypothetical protein